MSKQIKQVTFTEKPTRLLRVAAYARVSVEKDATLHSLSAQVSTYSSMIQSHKGWQYVGVYADEGITGTKETRANFQRLLDDCRAGKIDLIITKAISRFARNTVMLLETVRELKGLGVDVFFEEQNIHTLSAEGELMLTILASYAQEESLSASENMKWRVKQAFEQGKVWSPNILGYRANKDGQLYVIPEEAAIVKEIYDAYLSGLGAHRIAKMMTERGYLTKLGNTVWNTTTIHAILTNYKYTGNLLLQLTYTENHLTKKTCINTGEYPQYHVEGSHEAIIPSEMFDRVQEEIERRSKPFNNRKRQTTLDSPFCDKVFCDICGKKYRRKFIWNRYIWVCTTFSGKGKAYCPSKQIPEAILMEVATDVCGGDLNRIQKIIVANGNKLTFSLADGNVVERTWQDHSRADSWTREMRQAAGEKTRRMHQCRK